MRNFKNFFVVLFFALLALSGLAGAGVYAEENKDFVDLRFSIDSQTYSSMGIDKEMEVAPFIENGSTLVPLRVVLEELGFTVNWNEQQKFITATHEDKVIELQIDNYRAWVNGDEMKLSVCPKIVKESTVVPLRFMSEVSGANVVWDESTRSIYITKVGQYDTGLALFHEKLGESESNLIIYNGKTIKVIHFENEDIINWYTYNGKVIATLYDKLKNRNRVAILQNDKFVTVVNNFDIENAFEYNNNLLVIGYDDEQKYDKLYRFDGNSLILIDNNFYIGQYFLFKDQLVINKYNSSRDYKLLEFDKKSWNPNLLVDDFVIKGSVEDNNVLCMTGFRSQGREQPFVLYDGNYARIINENLPIDINKFASYNGKIYAIVKDENNDDILKVVDNNGINPVEFSYWGDNQLNYDITANLKLNYIKGYNGKLYLGLTGAKFVSHRRETLQEQIKILQGQIDLLQSNYSEEIQTRIDSLQLQIDTLQKQMEPIQKSLDAYNSQEIKGAVLETDSGSKFKVFINSNSVVDKMMVINNKLIILASQWLYVYDGVRLIDAVDVLDIKNSMSIGSKIYLDVTDIDRLKGEDGNGTPRNTVILIDGYKITNLSAKNFEVKNWAKLDDSLIVAGNEPDINENKVGMHKTQFTEMLRNFEIKYWKQIDEKIFTCGYNSINSTYKFARISKGQAISIADGLEVLDMIKAKGNYYFVYAATHSEDSPLDGRRKLYIYNDLTKKFIEMKGNTEIAKMVFVK